jgi:hypothetical protein
MTDSVIYTGSNFTAKPWYISSGVFTRSDFLGVSKEELNNVSEL